MVDNTIKYRDELGLKSPHGSLNLSVTGKSWRATLTCRQQDVSFVNDQEFFFIFPPMYISILILFNYLCIPIETQTQEKSSKFSDCFVGPELSKVTSLASVYFRSQTQVLGMTIWEIHKKNLSCPKSGNFSV